jgi:chitinase
MTAAVSLDGFAGPDGNRLTDLSQYANYLDYINMMSYDISGSWSSQTGPNSPLQSCGAGASVASGVATWVNAGFPASKILL